MLQVPEFVQAEGSFFVFHPKEHDGSKMPGSPQPAGWSNELRDHQDENQDRVKASLNNAVAELCHNGLTPNSSDAS
jgi:hypothetical protein